MASLPGGCPSPEAYIELIGSPNFANLRRHSKEFLGSNAEVLADYGAKWSIDPLEHWSRRWEYAYVAQQVKSSGANDIFDAGSGLTFFPSFLCVHTHANQVTCADIDSSYIETFRALKGPGQSDCRLMITDAANLGVASESFDATLCISVLEHMPNFREAASELARVTRPGGLICITFDIDLKPGAGGISFIGAQELLTELKKYGEPNEDYDQLLKEMSKQIIPLSQKWVKVYDRRNRSLADKLKFWIYTRVQRSKLQNLTFFCCSYTRREF
ncbi:MAG: class I SAM-dependent methyltransferase [Fimbriimonadaceae bacterium]